MQTIKPRSLAVAGLCAATVGVAAAPSAQAASVQVDLGTGPVVTVDTQTAQDAVGGVRTATLELVQAKLRQLNTGVVAPTTGRVANVLRQTGVTTFAVVGRSGRVVRGPGVVSVHSRRGVLDIGWQNDLRGCLQFALSNSLVPQVLTVDASMPLHTRVLTGRAATKASARDIAVAVVC